MSDKNLYYWFISLDEDDLHSFYGLLARLENDNEVAPKVKKQMEEYFSFFNNTDE